MARTAPLSLDRLESESRIRVLYEADEHLPANSIPCVVNRDIRISYWALERYCFRELSEMEYDLVILAGAVAFTDRKITRHVTAGWSRSLSVTMPVHDPARWKAPNVTRSLTDTLGFLTGDQWKFNFIRRTQPRQCFNQPDLSLFSDGPFVVIPFSNGLDSFAQSQLLRAEQPELSPIRVTTWNRAVSAHKQHWWEDAAGRHHPRLALPIKVDDGNHAEATYRTRAFLFYIFAALAAHLSQAESVIIPENGQGSLGPCLVPFAGEWPQRGSHPGFTKRLEIFLKCCLGSDIKFEHPRIWQTKGQVLQSLKEYSMLSGWEATNSCARDRRHVSVDLPNVNLHCGICGGCLLRRLTLYAADISSDNETYLWSDLSAPSLAKAMHSNAKRGTVANDEDIAACNVLALDAFARTAGLPEDSPKFQQAAFDLAFPNTTANKRIASKLKALVAEHEREWTSFLSSLPSSSWIRGYCTVN